MASKNIFKNVTRGVGPIDAAEYGSLTGRGWAVADVGEAPRVIFYGVCP